MRIALRIDRNGKRIRAWIDGHADQPDLILSHSLTSTSRMWHPQVEHFKNRCRLIRYDHRGHGGSDVWTAPYSLKDLSEDALRVMDELRIEKAHWCGVSLGAMVGMWLAIHAGDRIKSAVLANTAAYMGPASLWDDRIAHASLDGMQGILETTMTRWFPKQFRLNSPNVVESMAKLLRKTTVEGYCGCCAAIRDMDLRESLQQIKCPTLIIVGEVDLATPPKDGKFIRDSVPGARLISLKTGHISNVEQPTVFNEAVEAFLVENGAISHEEPQWLQSPPPTLGARDR